MRDVQKQIAEGSDILRSHPRYDLTQAEVIELFNQAGVKDSEAGKAYDVFTKALSLGISIGHRIAKAETKAKR